MSTACAVCACVWAYMFVSVNLEFDHLHSVSMFRLRQLYWASVIEGE